LSQSAGNSPLGLRLIGAFKFICGLLLIALGVGLFRHAKDDPAAEAAHIVSALKLDPDNYYIHTAIEKLSGIKPNQLKAIGAGTFLYALMYLVEGGGLLLRKHWAEYLTVVATGLFIPLEVYEAIKRPTMIRMALLAINVAIVAYLIYQLRRKGREGVGVAPSASQVSPTAPGSIT
jgi:uncharacterized membrane protein (DUF2068 family)